MWEQKLRGELGNKVSLQAIDRAGTQIQMDPSKGGAPITLLYSSEMRVELPYRDIH